MPVNPYASPVHLPFNRRALLSRFNPCPSDDLDGPGSNVLLRGTELLLAEEGEDLALPEDLPPGLSVEEAITIGRFDGRPCRVRRLTREAVPAPGFCFENLLAPEPRIPIELLSLGGLAGQILHWENNSRYCSRCGGGMERLPGEWGKRCTGCQYAHFPHIHPCIIVLVRRRGEVLLTRKSGWPAARYSLVAGFLEFGECLEEAVTREVMEETGVRVRGIRYAGSQSWPFPSQLMAGFVAEYDGGEVQVDEHELEDARWFRVDDLPLLPPRRSIARYLLDNFLPGRSSGPA